MLRETSACTAVNCCTALCRLSRFDNALVALNNGDEDEIAERAEMCNDVKEEVSLGRNTLNFVYNQYQY